MAVALKRELAARVELLNKQLRRVNAGSEERVHQARVELRRCRALVELMGETVAKRRRATRAILALRDIERRLGQFRDLDVLAAHLASYRERIPEEAAALSPLALLAVQRGKKAVAPTLAASDRKALIREMKKLTHDQALAAQSARKAKRTPDLVRHFWREVAWRRYDEILAYDVREPLSVRGLHGLRSACRQLRYTLETFDGALPAVGEVLSELRVLQDEVGGFHDHHVAIRQIRRWIERGKLERSVALERYVLSRLAEHRALRHARGSSWRHVLSPEFRAQLAHALEAGHTRPRQSEDRSLLS